MAKKKKRIVVSESSLGGVGSLGDVLRQAGFRESENAEAEPVKAQDIWDDGQQDLLAQTERIVIRKERKGLSSQRHRGLRH